MSMTERPVTHTTEVDVKRASIKLSLEFLEDTGRERKNAPIRAVRIKLRMSILWSDK